MVEVRRALGGDESADLQAEQVNDLLARALPDSDGEDAAVVLPARILQGIKGRSTLGDVVPLPEVPATPLAQSDLLVNAWLWRWRARRGARPIAEEEKADRARIERGPEEWRRWWRHDGERELRCILMTAWDPVGAGDAPEAWDEYDS